MKHLIWILFIVAWNYGAFAQLDTWSSTDSGYIANYSVVTEAPVAGGQDSIMGGGLGDDETIMSPPMW